MVANTETSKTEPNPAEMNEFEALLEQYDYDSPFRGQILSGVVISADDHEIMLDVGLKRDAFVPRTDLDRLDDDFLSTLRPGTEVRAYVMQPLNNDEELIVSINKGLELEDWEEAKRITDEDGIVKVTIVGTNRGGLLARFKRLTGFIPMSQITSIARFSSDYEMNQAKNDLVDDRLDVKIIEVDRLRNRLIFSERAAQSQLQRVAMNKLEVGQDVHGRVVGLVDFGAFVDIGGVDGLIHISKLDHRFVDHPGEILAIGDEVYVRIESIDEQNERISLNRKVLLPDPWQDLEFEEGQLVTVTVTNIVDFGVFVSMPNGLQGLIHVSNMQTLDTTNLRNVIREGDELLSKVITIDAERQRIGLSVDDVTVEEQEAWMFNRREDTDEEVTDEADETEDAE
ncbi:MAG: S1 RNA-binding domain-containing protein [Chloroflexota bacterium]